MDFEGVFGKVVKIDNKFVRGKKTIRTGESEIFNMHRRKSRLKINKLFELMANARVEKSHPSSKEQQVRRQHALYSFHSLREFVYTFHLCDTGSYC